MPTFITLLRWTDQGVRAVKESPQRLDAANRAVQAAGGKTVGFYMVLGDYDMVFITEARDDESYARIILGIASLGNVRTTTLKAFTEEEYRRIIAGLP